MPTVIDRLLLLLLILGMTMTDAMAKVAMEPVPPTPVAARPEVGQQLYRTHCRQCHGPSGAGDGPAADRVYPRPRDFTLALFKIRSTPSGQVPTDHDLFRVISEGLPGTTMPAWKKYLSEEERWQLVHHVKTLDTMGIFADEPAKERIAIGQPPEVTPEMVQKGRQLYEAKKCWQCHGKLGRGDGPSAEGMKDDWGHPIRPVNFTKSWRFRGGDRLEDIFRTFTTGLTGTPMPSFAETLPEDGDRWALATFVKSLARPQRTSQVLRARRHGGDLPEQTDDPAWAKAEFVDFPLAGQIILEPRWFTPAHDVITARALYNDREVALLVEWDDGSRNEGSNGRPPDRVTVQFPREDAATLDGEKPYFVLGDRRHGVDLWEWSGNGAMERRSAHGAERIATTPAASLQARGGYQDGQYRVIFRRSLTGDKGEVTFTPGQATPLAFHLRDGHAGEEGLKMAISAWYDLLLIPETPWHVHVLPVLFAVLTILGEVWLVRRLRRPAAVMAALLFLFLMAAPVAQAHEEGSATASFQRLAVNEPAASFTLRNQEGTVVSLGDFREQVVVMTFFYSTCTDVCPLLLHTLSEVWERLTPAERQRVRLVGITVDALRDTPDRLQGFMKEQGLDSRTWQLLTGETGGLTAVAQAYGVVVHPTPAGGFVHNSVFIVIDGQGRERAELHGVQTPVVALLDDIRMALQP